VPCRRPVGRGRSERPTDRLEKDMGPFHLALRRKGCRPRKTLRQSARRHSCPTAAWPLESRPDRNRVVPSTALTDNRPRLAHQRQGQQPANRPPARAAILQPPGQPLSPASTPGCPTIVGSRPHRRPPAQRLEPARTAESSSQMTDDERPARSPHTPPTARSTKRGRHDPTNSCDRRSDRASLARAPPPSLVHSCCSQPKPATLGSQQRAP